MGYISIKVKKNGTNRLIALMLLFFYLPAFLSQSTFSTSSHIHLTAVQSNYLSSTKIISSNNLAIQNESINISLSQHAGSSKFNISDTLKRALLSIVCISIIISCLVGNMLVIIAVIIVRKLHTQDNASNFLIVSLAVSDFLVGVLVMPYAFYVELSEENK